MIWALFKLFATPIVLLGALYLSLRWKENGRLLGVKKK